ncbi:hypothetical protein MBM_03239 [Drepanopeziza brunnea f. sp. 'multigermtubi' MB_m1]|uniref:Uncharacterized protein n=1 Tax=Marssonina brunnea f. sp. multigermtubi (strain MB_m1) TaxID=1072389 RepID=K1WZ43_MARBU|nr:uncharacterized protein MBM_03239 [Drepanopeziza brunnea f. sp. 'multigermtubi' MB_m1]EKD18246.1 hypothetical protein MBM_03239 [Drepanopeziza brunnea f. sp. 'multigermtubi' MB_m1]
MEASDPTPGQKILDKIANKESDLAQRTRLVVRSLLPRLPSRLYREMAQLTWTWSHGAGAASSLTTAANFPRIPVRRSASRSNNAPCPARSATSCRRRKAVLDATVKDVQSRVATRVLRTPSEVHVPQVVHVFDIESRFDIESSQSLDLTGTPPAQRALPPGIRPVCKPSFVAHLFIQGILLVWAFDHVPRAIKPLQYPGYTEGRRRSELVLAMVGGTLISGVSGLLFAFRFLAPFSHNICERLRIWRHTTDRNVVRLFLISFAACAALAFPVLFCALPSAAFSHQMEHSCLGFDTHVNLGDLGRPPTEFRLPDPTARNKSASHPRTAPDELFEIKQASDYGLGPHEGFRKFVRIKGKLHGTDMAIDFDLREQRWRMLRGTKRLPPVRSGSWYASGNHVTLPELRLQVPNLFYFSQACYYQPFMTVFRTDNMTDAQVEEQSGKRWSGTSEKNVVMRTMNSGTPWYLDDLGVCARTADYDVDVVVAGDGGDGGSVERRPGLGDDLIVPLGLMAALRSDQPFHTLAIITTYYLAAPVSWE